MDLAENEQFEHFEVNNLITLIKSLINKCLRNATKKASKTTCEVGLFIINDYLMNYSF